MSPNIIMHITASYFLGVILCSVLHGATLMQTWYYFYSFPEDSFYIKILVASLSTLGTAQMVLVSVSIYQYTIVWADNTVMSGDATPSSVASIGVSSLIAFTVQLAYAHRIWILSFRNRLFTVPIVVIALIALGFNGALLVESVLVPQWQNTRGNNLTVLMSSVASTACDFLIAGSQVYLFRRSNTVGRLSGVITRLTILVVDAGLLTSIDVTVFLMLFLVCPSNGAFLIPYIIMSPFYLNSFLAVLNSRVLLRELADTEEFSCPNIVVSSVAEFRIRPPSQAGATYPSLPASHTLSQTLSHSRVSRRSGVDSYPIMVVPRV